MLGRACCIAVALLAASGAAAQTTPDQSQAEEFTVTGRFLATGASSATKMNLSTLDTPFSVSAYTNDFMKAIHTTQVADLYRYMTGLQKAGATGYDLTLRGFSTIDSDRNTILVDGLPGLAVRFGSPPTVGLERVEIVKGAASLLYGAVQPGGFVNMVTKKPSADAFTEIGLRGTEGAAPVSSRVEGGDVSIDSTGPIGESGRLLYRLVAQTGNDLRFRDYAFERGDYVAPMMTWNVTDETSVTAQIEYRRVKSTYSNVFLLAPRLASGGTPVLTGPITNNYTAPSDYLSEDGMIESVFVTHEFDNGFKWTTTFRNVNHHDHARAFDMIGFDKTDPTLQTIDLRARGQRNQRVYVFGDTNMVMPFEALGIGHQMILGGSLGRETDDFARLQFCKINSPSSPKADPTCNKTAAKYTVNFLKPNFSNIPPEEYFGQGAINPSTLSENFVTGIGSGAYVSDLMTVTPEVKATVGLRWAHERQENYADLYEPLLGGVIQNSEALLPQVGAIYQPWKNVSFYASYSTSFSPVPPGTLGLNNSYNFKPTYGKGYEVGAKSDLLSERLTFTAALFEIDQTNTIVPYAGADQSVCVSGSCSVQLGAARSKGAEFEFSGHVLPDWTLATGYALTDARIVKSDASGPLVGGLLPNAPVHAAHLWSRYDLSEGPLHGLGVGFGYSYTGTRLAYTPTPSLPGKFSVPAYQIVDLGLYYTLMDRYSVTFMVNNLFDKTYYLSGQVTTGMANIVPGTPRTVTLNLAYRF